VPGVERVNQETNMKFHRHRIGVLTAALAFSVASFSASAWAHGDKGERFRKADKNGDGFITKDEVNDRKWARIQVADANGDSKISLEELKQAHRDGKIKGKHKHHEKKSS
jgi:hypothetical protein